MKTLISSNILYRKHVAAVFTLSAIFAVFASISHVSLLKRCLARVVTRSLRVSRPVSFLKSLHWLPVHYRIIFKICTKPCQAISLKQPLYLNSMLTPARHSRQLRPISNTSHSSGENEP